MIGPTMPSPCVHCGEIFELNDLWPDYELETGGGYAIQCGECKRARRTSACTGCECRCDGPPQDADPCGCDCAECDCAQRAYEESEG